MEFNGDGLRRSARYRLAEENPEKYIIGKGARKFKKDSRTWLHKSSKNFKPKNDVPRKAQSKPYIENTTEDSLPNGSEVAKVVDGEIQATGVTVVDDSQASKVSTLTLSSSVNGDKVVQGDIGGLRSDDAKSCKQDELNMADVHKAVHECISDADNVIDSSVQRDAIRGKDTNNLKIEFSSKCDKAKKDISLMAQHTGPSAVVEGLAGVIQCQEKSRSATLSDSELCLRAKNLALVSAATEEDTTGTKKVSNVDLAKGEEVSTPTSVSPKTDFLLIGATDSNSSHEKTTSKAVTKTLKTLTLVGRRKLHNNKALSASRKSRAQKTSKITCAVVRKQIIRKSTKDMRKAFRKALVHHRKQRQTSGGSKVRSTMAFIIKCRDERWLSKKDPEIPISCTDLAKQGKNKRRKKGHRVEAGKSMAPKSRITKDGKANQKAKHSPDALLKATESASGKPQDFGKMSTPRGEGHSGEDKLHRKRQPTSPLPDVGCRSSKSTVIESDRCVSPVQKLSEERKRKGSLPANKSTSADSIQEKRSRDSLGEDIKAFLSKRDRRPPRYKPLDTTLAMGSIQSASESSLQVQCSPTAESMLDTDSCPSSTLVEQGSLCSSTPTGVDSRHSLTDSDSVVCEEADFNHFAPAPSLGNHCLPTINIADLNDNLDSKMIESAYVLHRTVRKRFLNTESWELVSKSDGSLENKIKFLYE